MIPKGKGLSRFSIFHKVIRNNIKNKFYSKALCHKVSFPAVKFRNINFKGAVLTNCAFKKASFVNVEFLGTNLKNSNFSEATFKNCTFSAVQLRGANFKGSTFENCTFVSTNLNNAKNLQVTDNNDFLVSHSLPDLDNELLESINNYKFHPKLQNYRVLHLKKGKLNSLTMKQLISKLGAEKSKKGFINLDSYLTSRVITANQLCILVDKASNHKV